MMSMPLKPCITRKTELNPSYTHDGMAPGGYLKDRIGYYNNDPQNSIRNDMDCHTGTVMVTYMQIIR